MSLGLARRFVPWALLATLATGSTVAQRPGGFRTWARETVERMTERFGLTEQQKQQALVIYASVEENTRPLERKMADQRNALREAVKSNAPEWQIDQMAGALGAIASQLAALETKADAKFYALLTTEQRQKWDQPFPRFGRGPGGGRPKDSSPPH
jgi:Spy/CpxP family protein refolding chaperone